MAEKMNVEFRSVVLSDKERRTITGIVVPVGEFADRGGYKLTFAPNSVRFGDRNPLMMHHDDMQPIGKLIHAEWTDAGLFCKYKVSETPRGDEALTLAADGVLGFSVGVEIPPEGRTQVDDEMTVTDSLCYETSLTPIPAFAGAAVTNVNLSKDGATMPDTNEAANTAALSVIAEFKAAVEALKARPEPQPVPTVTVREEAPYRFDAIGGKHNFMKDAFYGYNKGDSEARTRVDAFLRERFVTQADVAALTPDGFRPDLYVGPRAERRVLGGYITGATINDNTPFAFPTWSGVVGNAVNPHTEGVEPALATVEPMGTDTVEPTAVSGKVAFTRETIDKVGPQAQGMVWDRMLVQHTRALEADIATTLADIELDAAQEFTLTGTGATLADNLDTDVFLTLDELERFGVLLATPALYGALYTARDTDGRKLFPAIGTAVNADGTARGRSALDLNGVVAVQARGLTTSYLLDPQAIVQFASTPDRLDFDIEVAKIYMGLWGYKATTVVDASGIIRLTYA